MNKESVLFTPATIGPLTLRNRTIRAAAFESMCPGNAPSEMLYNYHTSVAAGGIGMTTLAYAAVTQSGLSFERQLWTRLANVHQANRAPLALQVRMAKPHHSTSSPK